MEPNIEGISIGSSVSIIRERTAEDGSGPRLHRHPYAETFVIVGGRALFTLGDTQREGRAGDVLVAQANVPHKFVVIGPETYVAVHIHENPTFETEWLE